MCGMVGIAIKNLFYGYYFKNTPSPGSLLNIALPFWRYTPSAGLLLISIAPSMST
jgi:hypothetical protein